MHTCHSVICRCGYQSINQSLFQAKPIAKTATERITKKLTSLLNYAKHTHKHTERKKAKQGAYTDKHENRTQIITNTILVVDSIGLGRGAVSNHILNLRKTRWNSMRCRRRLCLDPSAMTLTFDLLTRKHNQCVSRPKAHNWPDFSEGEISANDYEDIAFTQSSGSSPAVTLTF